ncbi:DUF4136 domain-containing protein [Kordia algicida OT-1]|uniref:Bifunctional aldehyde dehydrogenase/enoyl-CoA hydratase n=1 Tax=Kordia algicida OT-1 TaxID=391587 RepID=A9DLZ8_9FLAO|nr:DUF4136 domain-containing protein [Kordia algicida]EDP97604.1 bifunctional aldehyde dehydrogenase/enoyl-CoA hydratase [Kordia algicida OT-1]
MKKIKLLFPVVALLLLVTSCVSVRVVADYDQEADFNSYKTFAFYKTGIDQAEISDLDKKRILRSIEKEMIARGFVKSENPDLLVNIMTKANKRINVNNNAFGGWGFGWGGGWGGWGWSPWMWGGGMNTVTTRTDGVLYIDLIDTKQKELVWQGRGTGNLNSRSMERKDQRIQEFVAEIMKEYPPVADAK